MTGEPLEPVDQGDGQRTFKVLDEVARLKRLGMAELKAEARACAIPKAKITAAATGDELRLAIIEKKLEEALT
jgi:hypothetical protein